MTDFVKAVDDFETACYALGDRGILDVGSDHMPARLLKQHETALAALMAFAPPSAGQEATTPSEERKLWPCHGYAPGGYECVCATCEEEFYAAKGCITCARCAIERAANALASPAVAPVAVSVKGLEWREDEENWYSAVPQLPQGYEVRTTLRGVVRSRWGREPFEDFDGTVEQAKAAAQSDFTARILSSIIPATKGGVAKP